MPTISRAKRQKARLKRSRSLLARGLRETAFAANRNFSTVMMLLAQAGGEVTIKASTVQSVVANIAKIQYAVQQLDEGQGFRIYTVVQDAVPTVDAATLPAESLDEMKARMNAAHNEVPEAPEGATARALRLEREAAPVDPTVDAGDPA
jgi:hypothetical protein